ncbi:MAG TPA: DUF1638 domain-containing protein [Thermoanaerobacterales bacterium]|nr:DUF1638 domain-containing protein [Thermoanaerobacterales bacterium]
MNSTLYSSFDDCISMLLSKPKEKFERMKATYFIAKGWIESYKGPALPPYAYII